MSVEKLFQVGIKGIVIKDNKVLIVKAGEGRDFWEVPGGRISGDESIEQALHRELREEVPNIHNIIMREVVDAYRVPHDILDNVSLVLVFYMVEADFDGEIQVSDEHVGHKWATEKEALELVNESVRTAITNAFKILKYEK